MSKIPHGYTEVVRVYGNPSDPQFYDTQTVYMKLPYPMRYSENTTQIIKFIRVHKLCTEELTAIFTDIWNYVRIKVKQEVGFDKTTSTYDRLTLAAIKKLGLDLFGGTYYYRNVRGKKRLSLHAFGVAIDLDPTSNPLGSKKGTMPFWVVSIFKKYGWKWGGDFKGRKDPMHFQRATGC